MKNTGAKRAVWALPLCAAVYWGSCTDDGCTVESVRPAKLSQSERDARWALCGFASSLAAMILVRRFLVGGP